MKQWKKYLSFCCLGLLMALGGMYISQQNLGEQLQGKLVGNTLQQCDYNFTTNIGPHFNTGSPLTVFEYNSFTIEGVTYDATTDPSVFPLTYDVAADPGGATFMANVNAFLASKMPSGNAISAITSAPSSNLKVDDSAEVFDAYTSTAYYADGNTLSANNPVNEGFCENVICGGVGETACEYDNCGDTNDQPCFVNGCDEILEVIGGTCEVSVTCGGEGADPCVGASAPEGCIAPAGAGDPAVPDSCCDAGLEYDVDTATCEPTPICGGNNEAPCTTGNYCGSTNDQACTADGCDTLLVLEGGLCVEASCGAEGEVPCQSCDRINGCTDYCNPGFSIVGGLCTASVACGADGQPACSSNDACVEPAAPGDPDLKSSCCDAGTVFNTTSGLCELATACGGEGQPVCTDPAGCDDLGTKTIEQCNEFGCDAGLVESGGVCVADNGGACDLYESCEANNACNPVTLCKNPPCPRFSGSLCPAECTDVNSFPEGFNPNDCPASCAEGEVEITGGNCAPCGELGERICDDEGYDCLAPGAADENGYCAYTSSACYLQAIIPTDRNNRGIQTITITAPDGTETVYNTDGTVGGDAYEAQLTNALILAGYSGFTVYSYPSNPEAHFFDIIVEGLGTTPPTVEITQIFANTDPITNTMTASESCEAAAPDVSITKEWVSGEYIITLQNFDSAGVAAYWYDAAPSGLELTSISSTYPYLISPEVDTTVNAAWGGCKLQGAGSADGTDVCVIRLQYNESNVCGDPVVNTAMLITGDEFESVRATPTATLETIYTDGNNSNNSSTDSNLSGTNGCTTDVTDFSIDKFLKGSGYYVLTIKNEGNTAGTAFAYDDLPGEITNVTLSETGPVLGSAYNDVTHDAAFYCSLEPGQQCSLGISFTEETDACGTVSNTAYLVTSKEYEQAVAGIYGGTKEYVDDVSTNNAVNPPVTFEATAGCGVTCDPGEVLNDGVCYPCGEEGQLQCDEPTDCEANPLGETCHNLCDQGLVPDVADDGNTYCVACGAEGQPACDVSTECTPESPEPCCDAGYNVDPVSGLCVAEPVAECGDVGQPVCPDDSCTAPFVTNPATGYCEPEAVCPYGPYFMHDLDFPTDLNKPDVNNIGLIGMPTTSFTYSWDVWSDGVTTAAPPAVPTVAPDTAGFLTTPLTGNLGNYNDNCDASPLSNGLNNYLRLTVTDTATSVAKEIYFYFHECGLIEDEPAMQHQVSFDGGATWTQMDGYQAAVPVPADFFTFSECDTACGQLGQPTCPDTGCEDPLVDTNGICAAECADLVTFPDLDFGTDTAYFYSITKGGVESIADIVWDRTGTDPLGTQFITDVQTWLDTTYGVGELTLAWNQPSLTVIVTGTAEDFEQLRVRREGSFPRIVDREFTNDCPDECGQLGQPTCPDGPACEDPLVDTNGICAAECADTVQGILNGDTSNRFRFGGATKGGVSTTATIEWDKVADPSATVFVAAIQSWFDTTYGVGEITVGLNFPNITYVVTGSSTDFQSIFTASSTGGRLWARFIGIFSNDCPDECGGPGQPQCPCDPLTDPMCTLCDDPATPEVETCDTGCDAGLAPHDHDANPATPEVCVACGADGQPPCDNGGDCDDPDTTVVETCEDDGCEAPAVYDPVTELCQTGTCGGVGQEQCPCDPLSDPMCTLCDDPATPDVVETCDTGCDAGLAPHDHDANPATPEVCVACGADGQPPCDNGGDCDDPDTTVVETCEDDGCEAPAVYDPVTELCQTGTCGGIGQPQCPCDPLSGDDCDLCDDPDTAEVEICDPVTDCDEGLIYNPETELCEVETLDDELCYRIDTARAEYTGITLGGYDFNFADYCANGIYVGEINDAGLAACIQSIYDAEGFAYSSIQPGSVELFDSGVAVGGMIGGDAAVGVEVPCPGTCGGVGQEQCPCDPLSDPMCTLCDDPATLDVVETCDTGCDAGLAPHDHDANPATPEVCVACGADGQPPCDNGGDCDDPDTTVVETCEDDGCEAPAVYDPVTELCQTGTCGGVGQEQCPCDPLSDPMCTLCDDPATPDVVETCDTGCDAGLAPHDHDANPATPEVCVACGADGQPPCDNGGDCDDPDTTVVETCDNDGCETGTVYDADLEICVSCGGVGQPHCPTGDECDDPMTDEVETCDDTACDDPDTTEVETCGETGCDEGLIMDSDGICQTPECGDLGASTCDDVTDCDDSDGVCNADGCDDFYVDIDGVCSDPQCGDYGQPACDNPNHCDDPDTTVVETCNDDGCEDPYENIAGICTLISCGGYGQAPCDDLTDCDDADGVCNPYGCDEALIVIGGVCTVEPTTNGDLSGTVTNTNGVFTSSTSTGGTSGGSGSSTSGGGGGSGPSQYWGGSYRPTGTPATIVTIDDSYVPLSAYVPPVYQAPVVQPVRYRERPITDIAVIPQTGFAEDLIANFGLDVMFPELDIEDEYYEAAVTLSLHEVIDSRSVDSLTRAVTRVEAAQVLLNAAEIPYEQVNHGQFHDVYDTWDEQVVQGVVRAGLMNPIDQHTFGATQELTWQELVYMVNFAFDLHDESVYAELGYDYLVDVLRDKDLATPYLLWEADADTRVTVGEYYHVLYRIIHMLDGDNDRYFDQMTLHFSQDSVPVHRTTLSESGSWAYDLSKGAVFYEDPRADEDRYIVLGHATGPADEPYTQVFSWVESGLNVGDEYTLEVDNRIETYIVTGKELINKTHTDPITEIDPHAEMTVITCDIDGSGEFDRRWVLGAKRLEVTWR